MTRGVPLARPLLRALLPVLLLLAAASPAHARQPPGPADTGGVTAVGGAGTGDAGDTGGTTTTDRGLWPGDDGTGQAPADGGLGGLLDLFPQLQQGPPPVTSATVPGTVARLRTDGRAAIPLGAPKRVRRLVSQYNRIVGKRYLWGGGHAVVEDRAYDCSGAVGYGLIKTGLLHTTMVSGRFARWAAAGPGRWVTIYANRSHVYAEVAGLRLDTSPYGDPAGASGVRWRSVVGARPGFRVRHPIGL